MVSHLPVLTCRLDVNVELTSQDKMALDGCTLEASVFHIDETDALNPAAPQPFRPAITQTLTAGDPLAWFAADTTSAVNREAAWNGAITKVGNAVLQHPACIIQTQFCKDRLVSCAARAISTFERNPTEHLLLARSTSKSDRSGISHGDSSFVDVLDINKRGMTLLLSSLPIPHDQLQSCLALPAAVSATESAAMPPVAAGPQHESHASF